MNLREFVYVLIMCNSIAILAGLAAVAISYLK